MNSGQQGAGKPAFVLGARDPEMRLIARLIVAAGLKYEEARLDGKRVYAGNAYRADPPLLAAWAGGTLYAVECRWRGAAPGVVHLDHHHPGDPGYGRPPAEYFQAASVGQVWGVLRQVLQASQPERWQALVAAHEREAHLVAAADHCLGAAYRGACPGIEPAALLHWTMTRRAAFEHRSVAELMAEFEASCRRIRELAVDHLADLRQLPQGTVAEAPQAACWTGIAVLSRVVDREGREKIGLLGASPEQVRRFLAGELVPGLGGYYGDPARGFAGGYVAADTVPEA